MHASPRPATTVTAVAGLALALLAVVAQRTEPALAAAGLLSAVAYGLAVTRGDIARARRAGFEMVWRESSRRLRLAVGQSRIVRAELRNRGDAVVHIEGLRPVVGEGLRAVVRNDRFDVLPGGFALVEMEVTARRVGRHAVHGLSLGASGVSAAFEVPLTFANVVGVEVVPGAIASGLSAPRSGRMRADPSAGRSRRRKGEGFELRELRELQPGDPFRRIAWRASARRGQLMVRELEAEERDVVWIVVDVSGDGRQGPVGAAPFDRLVDLACAVSLERARSGAAVGVALVSDRVVGWSRPQRGGADIERLASLWIEAGCHYGADRCGVSIDDLLRLVVEHARPLDPEGLADLPTGDIDALLARLKALHGRAPFAVEPPEAGHEYGHRDQAVRHYAASFGLDVAARVTGPATYDGIAEALRGIHRERPRATEVLILSLASHALGHSHRASLQEATVALRRRGVPMQWALVDARAGLEAPTGASLAVDALHLALAQERQKLAAKLAALGVRVVEAPSLTAPMQLERRQASS